MKIDSVIGNPPYQDSNGGGGNGKSAKAIYTDFIEKAVKLNVNHICMITPNRWLTEDSNNTWNLRKEILNNYDIDKIKIYSNSWDVFPTVGNIAGGVGYSLLCRGKDNINTKVINNIRGNIIEAETQYSMNDDIIITDAVGIGIIKKLKGERTLSDLVSQSNPFGLSSDEKPDTSDDEYCCDVVTSGGIIKVKRERIYKNELLLKSYKVLVSKYAPSGGFADKDGKFKVISRSEVLEPNKACTQSYLVIGPIETEEESINLCEYLKLKLPRFLMLMALTGMSISESTFKYVPIQDFMKSYTDDMLYKKYNLSTQEIKYINNLIKDFGG